jgi:GH25 family lysozyme M1 (1,4-beta-N-acetylmuramidase)
MATLNGVDVSSYQRGIDLAKLPVDFVIVKATEGTGYVNPDCARAVEQALAAGKIVGVYHYVNGAGSTAEADHFVSSCKGWIGKVIFAIDWESGGNKAWGNTGYLDAVIKRVKASTGKAPLLYASASVFPWAIAKANDCGTWVAEYANTRATGFQTSPWHSKSWTGSCLIRQYTDNLRIPGWNGGLDGNVAFCDRATLARYISGTATATTVRSAAKPAADALSDGVWGPATTKALQKILGTPQDGVISSQDQGRRVNVPAAGAGWEWVANPQGSLAIKVYQQKLGIDADGIIGPGTIKRLQGHLGVPVDGYAGAQTVKALQAKLSRGAL